MSAVPTIDELEELFVNNDALNRIAAHLARFNPIKTMRMERQEIRHSAILAWLLDPSETHGLSDRFLKAFLGEAFRGRQDLGRPMALDIAQSDLRDAEVRREWQHIDIFVRSARNGWAFVIENKFDSRQHEGQLSKYADRVRTIYSDDSRPSIVRGVFLTLHGEEPEDESFATIGYEAIVALLSRLIASESEAVSSDVAVFIRHYLDILRDATGMSEEVKELALLARQLYRQHRKALDFIAEHGQTTDFSLAIETLFGDELDYGVRSKIGGAEYMYAWHNQNRLGIMPWAWVEAFGGIETEWDGCDDWQAGFPAALWFRMEESEDGASGSIKVKAEIGPLTNYDCRSQLIEQIRDIVSTEGLKDLGFRSDAGNQGRRFSRFLGKGSAPVQDTSDAAQIADAIKKLLKRHEEALLKLTPAMASVRKFGEVD